MLRISFQVWIRVSYLIVCKVSLARLSWHNLTSFISPRAHNKLQISTETNCLGKRVIISQNKVMVARRPH